MIWPTKHVDWTNKTVVMWDQLSDLTTICPWWISRGTTPKSGIHFRFGNRCNQIQMLVKIGGTIMKWWVFNGSTGFFYTSQWWRIERHAIQWQRVSEGQFDGLQDQSSLGLFFRLMMVGWRVSHEFPIKTFKIHGNEVRWGFRMMIPITDSVGVLRIVSGQQSIDGVFLDFP